MTTMPDSNYMDRDTLHNWENTELPEPNKHDALQNRIESLNTHFIWRQSEFNTSRQAYYLDDQLNDLIDICHNINYAIDKFKAAHDVIKNPENNPYNKHSQEQIYNTFDDIKHFKREIYIPDESTATDIIYLCDEEIDKLKSTLWEQGFELEDKSIPLNRELFMDTRQLTYSRYAINHAINEYNNEQIQQFLPTGTRIWVNGPKEYDPETVNLVMNNLLPDIPDSYLIHNNAPGLQQHVSLWAFTNKIIQIRCTPDFKTWPFSANSPAPFKNIERIAKGFGEDHHKPKLLISFHDPNLKQQPGTVLNAEQRANEQKIPVQIHLSRNKEEQTSTHTEHQVDDDILMEKDYER